MAYELFQDDVFIKTLLSALPCGVMVFDQERRLRQINDVLGQALGISRQEALGKYGGDVLGCIHAKESPKGCGSSKYCDHCQARKAALNALEGKLINKSRAAFQLTLDGRVYDVALLISAAPFEYAGERFAVVILEDISKLHVLHHIAAVEKSPDRIIGRNAAILDLHKLIHEAAQFELPVLIQGESGTGKELVAKAIHRGSSKREGAFVPVNCGALPHGLLESELFGHVKGAFTGAIRDKKGRFELANDGTIFLDEIGELDQSLQVKLLRVLQEGCFERIGGTSTIKVNVRVISATNKNLQHEVKAGRFRLDLFYRLCVVPITAPPLRERRDDIPLLVDHFYARFSKQFGRGKVSVSPRSLSVLQQYNWPGNVRELQNVIQYSLMKCKGGTIGPEHFPSYIAMHADEIPLGKRRKKKLEEQAVREALKKTLGNKVEAARELGVARATLYRFINESSDCKNLINPHS